MSCSFLEAKIGAKVDAKRVEGVWLQVSISYRCSTSSATDWYIARDVCVGKVGKWKVFSKPVGNRQIAV